MAMNAMAALRQPPRWARTRRAGPRRWPASRRWQAAARAGGRGCRRQGAAAGRKLQRFRGLRARGSRGAGAAAGGAARRRAGRHAGTGRRRGRQNTPLWPSGRAAADLLFTCGPLMRGAVRCRAAGAARRACGRSGGAGAAGRRGAAAGRRGAGQGQPGQPHEADRAGARRCRPAPAAGAGLMLLQSVPPAGRPIHPVQPVPLPHVPRGRRLPDRAGAQPAVRADVHPLAETVQRSGQPIRPDGPERHLIEKKGTPTMGGVLILAA